MTEQINTQLGTSEICFTKIGLPTEGGNTLKCRRKFFMGCRDPPPSTRGS